MLLTACGSGVLQEQGLPLAADDAVELRVLLLSGVKLPLLSNLVNDEEGVVLSHGEEDLPEEYSADWLLWIIIWKVPCEVLVLLEVLEHRLIGELRPLGRVELSDVTEEDELLLLLHDYHNDMNMLDALTLTEELEAAVSVRRKIKEELVVNVGVQGPLAAEAPEELVDLVNIGHELRCYLIDLHYKKYYSRIF